MKRRNWRKITILSVIFVLALPLSFLSLKIGNYFSHVDRFNLQAKRQNQTGALTELYHLRLFQSGFDWFPASWVTNRTIFRNSGLREGSYIYLTGDYNETEKALEKLSDHRAYHIRGSADFRLAQAAYRAGINKTVKGRQALDMLIENSKNKFELALRGGDGTNFDDVWNYDLLTNPRQRTQALSNQKSNVPIVILGFKEGENDGRQPQPGKKDPLGRDLPQSKSRAGESGSPRRTP